MTDLSPSPLAGGLAQPEMIGAIRMAPSTDRLVVSVACRSGARDTLSARMADVFGVVLPEAGRLEACRGLTMLSSALDQWFIEKAGHPAADFAAEVAQVVGDSASVTDQSGGWVRFDISGAGLEDMFARLCPVDLASFGPGDVARTRIHHIGCFVWRQGEALGVMSPRSTAASLVHALRDAARSITPFE